MSNKYQDNSKTQDLISQPSVPPSPQVKGVETENTSPPPSPKSISRSPIYLGLWTQGFFDPNNNSLHSEVLTVLQSKIGKKVAIAHYYRGWEALDSPQLLSQLQTLNSNGWRPMISANPYFFDRCSSNGMSLYKAIASGNCDEFIKNIGHNLKQLRQPVFLRFAWEMNIPSMEWQIGKVGSSNEDFILAWRKMHDLVYSEGATNVLWVFSPDVGNINYQDIYPGDGYVDWIGLDGYNWGTTQSWSKWQSFSQIFFQAYESITKVAPNKPLMIAEVNTTDKGGDKALWYQDMLSTQLISNFPKIRAVVFYNEDRTAKENVNWLIDISQSSFNSFSQNIQNTIYLSSF